MVKSDWDKTKRRSDRIRRVDSPFYPSNLASPTWGFWKDPFNHRKNCLDLVGIWTNLFEKYAEVKLDHIFWGEGKNTYSKPSASYGWRDSPSFKVKFHNPSQSELRKESPFNEKKQKQKPEQPKKQHQPSSNFQQSSAQIITWSCPTCVAESSVIWVCRSFTVSSSCSNMSCWTLDPRKPSSHEDWKNDFINEKKHKHTHTHTLNHTHTHLRDGAF